MLLICKLNPTVKCPSESLLALVHSCVREERSGEERRVWSRENWGESKKSMNFAGRGNALPISTRIKSILQNSVEFFSLPQSVNVIA